MEQLYAKSRRTNRDIALAILATLLANALGITRMLGLNLDAYGIAGFTATHLITVVGLAWVTFGLYKYKFGS